MEINQDRLISLAAGFQYSKILLAANEAGIFRFIGGGSRSADDIAAGLRLDREAVGVLMGALVGLELVTQRGGRFKNAPDVKKYLAEDSEESLACISRHMNHLYETWADLDRVVKKGRPRRREAPKLITDRKHNLDFICGMFEIGYSQALAVADALDMRGVIKFADIGGGPAQYPLALSAKNPDTGFIVADYPNTIKVAKGYIKKYGLGKRVKTVVCRFFDEGELGIGDDYDMALLSQVLHAASDEDCLKLLGKVFRILKPGGRVVINENALDDSRFSPPPPLLFSVNMLINTGGRAFTAGELKGWLGKAGFAGIKSRRLSPRSVLLEGTKPAVKAR